MQRCKQCDRALKVGDEVHVVDDNTFCSDECAIVYLTNEIIMSAKEQAKELYNSNVTILTLRPTQDTAECAVCKQDLAKCNSIWAAEGKMYCSRECGIRDYSLTTSDDLGYAEEIFDGVAEELLPEDIGLTRYLNKIEILSVIQSLAKSHGRYSRLLAALEEDKSLKETVLDGLESKHFKDIVGLVLYLEGEY